MRDLAGDVVGRRGEDNARPVTTAVSLSLSDRYRAGIVAGTAVLAGWACTPWGHVLAHAGPDTAGSPALRGWLSWIAMVALLVVLPARASGDRVGAERLAGWGLLGGASITGDLVGHALFDEGSAARLVAASAATALALAGVFGAPLVARTAATRGLHAPAIDAAALADAALMVSMHVAGANRPLAVTAFGASMLLAHGSARARGVAAVLAAAGIWVAMLS